MRRPIRRSAWIVFLLIACLTVLTFVHVHVLQSSDGTTFDDGYRTIWKPRTLVNTIRDTDDFTVADSYPFREMTTTEVAKSDYHEMTIGNKPLVLIWNAPNTPLPSVPTADICGGGCEISDDRTRIQESSAVVFHMKGVLVNDIPDQNSRDGNQVYVWWSEDSPWMSKHMYMYNSSEQLRAYDNNFFNWTMTYKPSSDVNAMMIPYSAIDFVIQGMARNWSNDAFYSSNGNSKSQREIDQLKMQARSLIEKKSKMAIWIASNCGYTAAAVLRRKIVTDLQFHGLEVDVYGQCGDTNIPDDLSGFLNLISQYKFSLAFENALHCNSYISEKFWYNGLYAGTIPIVWGPIKSDLEAIAPDKSYIYYDDFTSSESLVQHLHHISKNKTKYMEYLSWWWKSPGTFPVFGITEFHKDLKDRSVTFQTKSQLVNPTIMKDVKITRRMLRHSTHPQQNLKRPNATRSWLWQNKSFMIPSAHTKYSKEGNQCVCKSECLVLSQSELSKKSIERGKMEEESLLTGSNARIISGGWTWHLILAASAAVVGSSFQFGYNTGVINAPGTIIQQFINETYHERYGSYVSALSLSVLWALAVSIFAIGGMMGSLLAGYSVNQIGRKRTMLGNNVIAMIAIIFMGCSKVAKSFEMLIIGRLIIGVNCGINTAVAPLYLTEIAPVKLRGVLGSSNQLGIVIAMLIAEVLGLNQALGTAESWPLLLILCGVFALYQLLILPLCPETPAYLVSKGMLDEAKYSLVFLRGRQYDVDQELENLKSDISHIQDEDKTSIRDIFSMPNLRQPMIIAGALQLSQQLSGITAALYYSTSIFVSAGVSPASSDLVTVGMGIANVLMVTISLFLVDRLGRRVLMLTGLGGMFVGSVILVISLTIGGHAHWGAVTAIVAIMLFVIAFQTGPGSIPWFITAELFAENARASAMSVAGIINWSANFVVGIAYLPLQNVIDGYTFTIFATLLAIFWIFTYLKVPETKGRRVEEISRLFDGE